MGNASSPPKQIQLEFEFLSLDAEPISLSNNPSILSGLPKEILEKIADFIGIRMIQNFMIACKSIRNRLNDSFLRALASETYPDRATSGFIADAIGNNGDTRLWLNAKFSLGGHIIPKGLSIHLFTNKAASKILSHEVRSMIIQLSESSESPELYLNSCEFLTFLFSKVSFTKLKCLMLYGFYISDKVPQRYKSSLWHPFTHFMGKLELEVFHIAKFSFRSNLASTLLSNYCKTLERLYVVHPLISQIEFAPEGLKKLVIYCPESDEDAIRRNQERHNPGLLTIHAGHCCALEEM
jgi:hypothetical protein